MERSPSLKILDVDIRSPVYMKLKVLVVIVDGCWKKDFIKMSFVQILPFLWLVGRLVLWRALWRAIQSLKIVALEGSSVSVVTDV